MRHADITQEDIDAAIKTYYEDQDTGPASGAGKSDPLPPAHIEALTSLMLGLEKPLPRIAPSSDHRTATVDEVAEALAKLGHETRAEQHGKSKRRPALR